MFAVVSGSNLTTIRRESSTDHPNWCVPCVTKSAYLAHGGFTSVFPSAHLLTHFLYAVCN
jgi:hypothetical protein